MNRGVFRRFRVPLLCAVGALAAMHASATTLLQMNLEQLCERSERIFRGTVLNSRVGTVEAGGVSVPTVTYTIRVEEAFKGEFKTVKGVPVAEVRMVGKSDPVRSGDRQRFPLLRDLPTIKVGETYLLLTTAPSAVGLSTTVGLGQGRFHVFGKPGSEQAVNEYRNRGLFGEPGVAARAAASAPTLGPTPTGPVPYAVLADRIRAIVGAR